MDSKDRGHESVKAYAICMAMFGIVLWIDPRTATSVGPVMILLSLVKLWASSRPQPTAEENEKPIGMWILAAGMVSCLAVVAAFELIHPGPPDSLWFRLIVSPIIPGLVGYHLITEHNRRLSEKTAQP